MIPWPAYDSLVHRYITHGENRARHGVTPDGVFPGATSVLKVLGLGQEHLIKWGGRVEREAALAACEHVFDRVAGGDIVHGAAFSELVALQMGPERSAAKVLSKAADIGTNTHDWAKWYLRKQLGEVGAEPKILAGAEIAVNSWLRWWGSAHLKPLRIEQPIWHPAYGYSGTADLIAESDGTVFPAGVGILDTKTGSGIYLEHHLQLRAYVEGGRRHADIGWGAAVHLPKMAGNPFDAEKDVELMGDWRYGNRKFTEEELLEAFLAALTAWKILIGGNDV